VDKAELEKPTVKPDLPIHCDLKLFLKELAAQLNETGYTPKHSDWLAMVPRASSTLSGCAARDNVKRTLR